MKKQEHIIENQHIDIELDGFDPSQVKALQEHVIKVYKNYLAEELDTLFSEIADPNVNLALDKLVIDLGDIPMQTYKDIGRLTQELKVTFKEKATKSVKKEVKKIEEQLKKSKAKHKELSLLAIFEHFLLYGYYPSWAALDNLKIQELFRKLYGTQPQQLARVIAAYSKNTQVIKRLYFQFSKDDLYTIFLLLFTTDSQKAKELIRRLQQRFKFKYQYNFSKEIYGAAIQYAFEQIASGLSSKQFSIEHFRKKIVGIIERDYVPKFAKNSQKVSNQVSRAYQDKYQNIDILEYFLDYGSIPHWANVSSLDNVQKIFNDVLMHNSLALQRLIQRNMHKRHFIQRLTYQFPLEDVLQTIEPSSVQNLEFIQSSIKQLDILTQKRKGLKRTLSKGELRHIALQTAFRYVFNRKGKRFYKQVYLYELFEDLAFELEVDYEQLVHISYRSLSRKKSSSQLTEELAKLNTSVKGKLRADEKALAKALGAEQAATASLKAILARLAAANLSSSEFERLHKKEQQLREEIQKNRIKIDQLIDEDSPLSIEQIFKDRQLVREQYAFDKIQSIDSQLNELDKEFRQMQGLMSKNIEKNLAALADLEEKWDSTSRKKIGRLESRLRRYERSIGNVLTEVNLDEQQLLLFNQELDWLLKQGGTQEERTKLQQRQRQLAKDLKQLLFYKDELTAMQNRLKEELNKQKQYRQSNQEEEAKGKQHSRMDYLLFFLRYGAMPWWAGEFQNESVENLFIEISKSNPNKLKSNLAQLGNNPLVWQRLCQQLSEKKIEEALQNLYVSQLKDIKGQAEMLFKIHYSQALPQVSKVNEKEFKWAKLLELLFGRNRALTKERLFKELLLGTAQAYRLAPKELLNYMQTLSENYPNSSYGSFAKIAKQLNEDKEINLAAFSHRKQEQEQRRLEQGGDLSLEEQLNLLIDYLQQNYISDDAKKHQFKRHQDFEYLLYRLSDEYTQNLQTRLQAIIGMEQVQELIANAFSTSAYWEIVQRVKSSAVITGMHYFEDLAKVIKASDLQLAKQEFIDFIARNPSSRFEVKDYIKGWVVRYSKNKNSSIADALAELKQNSVQLVGKSKSSLPAMLRIIEVEWYKAKLGEEEVDKAGIEAKITALSGEYSAVTQQYLSIFSREYSETEGISKEDLSYKAIKQGLEDLEQELVALNQTFKALPPTALLKGIELRRKIAETEAKLSLLQRKNPTQLRLIKEEIRELNQKIQNLEPAIESAKNKVKLELTQEKESLAIVWTNLLKQADLAITLPQDPLKALEKLPQLLKELEDDDASSILFFQNAMDLLTLVPKIEEHKDYKALKQRWAELQSKLIDQQALLAENQKLSQVLLQGVKEKQQKLVEQIGQTAPYALIQSWKEIEQSTQELISQLEEKDRQQLQAIQGRIYRKINRLYQQNFVEYAKLMRRQQLDLEQKIQRTTDTNLLIGELKEDLQQALQQQRYTVDEMQQVAHTDNLRLQSRQMSENIEKYFKQLERQRIERYNQIVSTEQEDLEAERERARLRKESLEQDYQFRELELLKESGEQKTIKKSKNSRKKKELPPPPPPPEPLHIKNAGLVILHPYLLRLFMMLKYVQGASFVSEEAQFKAVHLLQYMVSGQLESAENELLLNKLLCGLAITTPVPTSMPLTEAELKIADSLMTAAIKSWPKMQNMSIEAMRTTFLMREGTFEEKADRYFVHVFKQTFDILMRTLPWGYTFVKLPWMDKFLSVDWPSM